MKKTMAKVNWMKELGWSQDHLDEIRNTAYSYVRQGQYQIALPLFEALAILSTDNAYDLQTLGAIYVQINQPLKAIQVLDKALQLDSDHSATLLNLTKAFFMSGKVEDGLRLAKLLEKDRNPYVSGAASALVLSYSKPIK